MMENKKYQSIMSFGCMCSTALFLRKNGFRSESTIFDWFSSNLESNLKLLDENFKDLLKREYLSQPYNDFPHIIDNEYYKISLNHLFNEYQTFDRQIKKVEKFCKKRIDRFVNNLKKGQSLLVYYSRDEKECDWISKNEDRLRNYCDLYGFDWLFITNYPLRKDFSFPHFLIPFNNVHKPYGGNVSFPFENDEIIISYLKSHYPSELILENLKHKNKRHLFRRLVRRLQKKNGIKLKI